MPFLRNIKRRLLGGIVVILVIFVTIDMMYSSERVQYAQHLGESVREVFGHINSSTANISGNASLTGPVSNARALPHIKKKYDLLINSYMNSGSRFTGSLFGFRKEAFYFYEPLWNFGVWDYYDAPNLVCKSTEGINCRVGSAGNVNTIKHSGRAVKAVSNIKPNSSVTDMMLDVLNDIYECDFTRLENLVVPAVHDKADLAGNSWASYRDCMRLRVPKKTCLQRQMALCKNSSHKITKVLRITTGSLDNLMEKRDNLKIIQLFRNPMAIVNSRTESRGYPVRDFNSNAAVLCKKMAKDYEGAMRLQRKYPDRVKLIFYEDIKTNVEEKMRKLYDFIDMEYNELEVKRLNKVKTNVAKSNTPQIKQSRVQDNAHWWRAHMSYTRYKGAMDNCKTVAKYFSLTYFADRSHLMRLTVPEMKLPSHLIVEV